MESRRRVGDWDGACIGERRNGNENELNHARERGIEGKEGDVVLLTLRRISGDARASREGGEVAGPRRARARSKLQWRRRGS